MEAILDKDRTEGSIERAANLQSMASPASVALAVVSIAAVLAAFGYQAISQNSVLLSYVREALGVGS